MLSIHLYTCNEWIITISLSLYFRSTIALYFIFAFFGMIISKNKYQQHYDKFCRLVRKELKYFHYNSSILYL